MTRTCRLCGCTDARACVTDGVACHWVGLALCSACVTAALTTTGRPRDPQLVSALKSAWADFDRAEIGRLNITREALEAAAKPLGWAFPAPLLEWCRAVIAWEGR